MIGGAILVNDSTTLKHEKMKFQQMTNYDGFNSKKTQKRLF